MSTQQGFAGQAGKSNSTSDYNKIMFLIRQMIGQIRTVSVVRVEAVDGGGAAPIGTVDVTVLVNLVDGLGNATEHAIISGLPFCRVQGGSNAIICDPQVGDVGIAVFGDRDISAVKASKGQRSNPGSRRRYDWADGMYVFPVIAQAPTSYIQFNEDGSITIQGNVNVVGTLTNNGVDVGSTHFHGGVTTGGGVTSPPAG